MNRAAVQPLELRHASPRDAESLGEAFDDGAFFRKELVVSSARCQCQGNREFGIIPVAVEFRRNAIQMELGIRWACLLELSKHRFHGCRAERSGCQAAQSAPQGIELLWVEFAVRSHHDVHGLRERPHTDVKGRLFRGESFAPWARKHGRGSGTQKTVTQPFERRLAHAPWIMAGMCVLTVS